jgi:hypothetical protein
VNWTKIEVPNFKQQARRVKYNLKYGQGTLITQGVNVKYKQP